MCRGFDSLSVHQKTALKAPESSGVVAFMALLPLFFSLPASTYILLLWAIFRSSVVHQTQPELIILLLAVALLNGSTDGRVPHPQACWW